MDIIVTYCFAECFDALDAKGFQHEIMSSIESAVEMGIVFKHFTWFMKLMFCLPERISMMLNPHANGLFALKTASLFIVRVYESFTYASLVSCEAV
jgi:hypothetical protein